ncbi:T6SS effector phospholipase Tle3 domain-containing protein [Burkholderia cenocepacia]|uniref:T6SS effector phospholipase Tle3 domain-containing protein n=1 Tax=Burkholderia cenocepacia TaxID=95486 RepID=UPI003F49D837
MQNELICVKQPPLPGVIIFVHGVNSEGEWYEGAEKGLCKGLNRRLARLDDQLDHKGVIGGQMSPVAYTESLTPDGFLNPKLWAGNYIKPDPSFSPVIHFRWGYKANKEELKEYGDKIFLNEKNYWGGGPFANGCSSLPDLWHEGLDDRIFGWISVQAMNPTTRPLYRTPPRTYGVLAALRLAKLVESIRRKQANVPITIVCHSQGNMVGLTAAFFGDQLTEVTDPWGNKGRCVADAYVLANPPYSVANTNTGMDTWSQRDIKDHKNGRGRETYEARTKTLRAFLDIIRARSAFEPPADKVDREMGNCRTAEQGKPYSADADRNTHGLNGHTYGRVTLYCCPHDQVISAVTVQGIGWRGLGRIKDATKEDGPSKELIDIGADGVLTQRVFATHWEVGKVGDYSYWTNDWRYGKKGTTPGFWFPPSPPAKFGTGPRMERKRESNRQAIYDSLRTGSLPGDDGHVGFQVVSGQCRPSRVLDGERRRAGARRTVHSPKTYRSNDPEHLNPIKIRDGEAESDFNDGYDTPGIGPERPRRRTSNPTIRTTPISRNRLTIYPMAMSVAKRRNVTRTVRFCGCARVVTAARRGWTTKVT